VSDIVERLRNGQGIGINLTLCREAADEIERLRAGLREAIDDCKEARKQRDVRDMFLVQSELWGEFVKWLTALQPPETP